VILIDESINFKDKSLVFSTFLFSRQKIFQEIKAITFSDVLSKIYHSYNALEKKINYFITQLYPMIND